MWKFTKSWFRLGFFIIFGWRRSQLFNAIASKPLYVGKGQCICKHFSLHRAVCFSWPCLVPDWPACNNLWCPETETTGSDTANVARITCLSFFLYIASWGSWKSIGWHYMIWPIIELYYLCILYIYKYQSDSIRAQIKLITYILLRHKDYLRLFWLQFPYMFLPACAV